MFVNGCFWHMHENYKYSSIPKSDHEFWENKLEGNVKKIRKTRLNLEVWALK